MNILEKMEVVIVNKMLAKEIGLNKALIAYKLNEIVNEWNKTEQFYVSLSDLVNVLLSSFPFFTEDQVEDIINELIGDNFLSIREDSDTFDLASNVFEFYLGGEL